MIRYYESGGRQLCVRVDPVKLCARTVIEAHQQVLIYIRNRANVSLPDKNWISATRRSATGSGLVRKGKLVRSQCPSRRAAGSGRGLGNRALQNDFAPRGGHEGSLYSRQCCAR